MSQRQKFEREIDEILSRLDDFPRKRRKIRVRRKVADQLARVGDAISAVTSRISVGQVMLAAIVLIVAAFFFRDLDRQVTTYLIILGLVLFVGAFIASVLPQGVSRRQQRYWRGQVIDYGPPSAWDRLRAFLGRLGRRR
ncbi:MAG TPA: hypothetical protein VIO14_14140 [Dehalococcoidia bacterium]